MDWNNFGATNKLIYELNMELWMDRNGKLGLQQNHISPVAKRSYMIIEDSWWEQERCMLSIAKIQLINHVVQFEASRAC